MRSRCTAAAFVLAILAGGCSEPVSTSSGVEAFEEGMLALDTGDAGRAERTFAAMVEGDPSDPVARAGLARALARQGRYAEAIVQDKLAYAADPRLAEVAYNISCSYAALGDSEEALRWLARAWDGGIRDLNLIEQDPDLLPLRSDHRFAFFLATGALSLSEQEAYVRVSPAMVFPGDEVRVEVVVVSLNRPLMATPERLDLRFAGELPDGVVEPEERIELFEAGEIGGREYFRRFITYRFVAHDAVEALLGPFELTLGGVDIAVRPAWLSVQDVLPGLFPDDREEEPDRAIPNAAAWFAAPGTITEGRAHPFASWERAENDALDLIVGVEQFGDGLVVPDDLEIEIAAGACGPWLHPRKTAFLRTRAEGLSRVWFHRRWGGGSTPADTCPDPLPVKVTMGGETIYEDTVAWP